MAKINKTFILHAHPRPVYPYFILGMAILFHFYKFMLLSFPEVIAPYLMKDLSLSLLQVRTLSAAGIHIMIFTQLPIGFLIDRFAPNKIVSIGILLASVGAYLFAISDTFLMAVIARLLIGCGVSFAFINTLKLISNWFYPERFALLAGFSLSFGVLGGLVSEIYFFHFSKIFGWRPILMHVSIIGFIYALVYLLVVRDNEPGMKYDINPNIRKFSFAKSIKKCFRHSQTWFICSYVGLVVAPMLIFVGVWGIGFFRKRYVVSSDEALWLQMAFIFAYVVSTPLIGYLSTKKKRRKPFIVIGTFLVLALILVMIFTAIKSLAFGICLVIMTGFAGGTSALPYTIIHERNVPKITGTVIGLLGSVLTLFAVTEFHLMHYLFRIVPSILDFIVVPSCIFLGFIFSFFIRETYAKQRLVENYRIR